MKVKNIMFSGVMASILMMGGAYATGNANNDLATAGFVRGAYNAAVAQAINNVVKGDGVTITKSGEGDAATATIAIDTTAVQGKLTDAQMNAVNSGITKAKVDAYDGYATTIAAKANSADVYTKTQVDALPAVASGITSTKVSGYDTHVANADIHVTAAQKEAWTAKQDALDDTQMAAVNSGITSAKVGTYDGYAATIAANTSAISAEETRAKGVEATNAAAAAAAQADVDALEITVSTLSDEVDTKAAAADLETLAGRVTTAENDIDALEAKVGTENVGDQIDAKIDELDLENTYAAKSYEATVDTLNGADTVDGSVKKQIKDAVAAEATRSDNTYATKSALSAVESTANAAATQTYVDTELGKKQNTLTAGTNIAIGDDGTISATDTKYTAGTGLVLNGTAFSLGYDVTNGEFSK